MKIFGVMITVVMMTFSMAVSAQTLDELAEIVRRAAVSEGQINKQREDQFLSDRNNQQNLLTQARAEKRREEKRSDDLKSEYDRLERELAELTTVLHPHNAPDEVFSCPNWHNARPCPMSRS
jgi:septal ring factor EnvC (AmiA/AmiB activator)